MHTTTLTVTFRTLIPRTSAEAPRTRSLLASCLRSKLFLWDLRPTWDKGTGTTERHLCLQVVTGLPICSYKNYRDNGVLSLWTTLTSMVDVPSQTETEFRVRLLLRTLNLQVVSRTTSMQPHEHAQVVETLQPKRLLPCTSREQRLSQAT